MCDERVEVPKWALRQMIYLVYDSKGRDETCPIMRSSHHAGECVEGVGKVEMRVGDVDALIRAGLRHLRSTWGREEYPEYDYEIDVRSTCPPLRALVVARESGGQDVH